MRAMAKNREVVGASAGGAVAWRLLRQRAVRGCSPVDADSFDESRAKHVEPSTPETAFQIGVGSLGGRLDRVLELGAAGGETDEATAAILGVDLTGEVSAAFKFAQEVVDGLFGDLQLLGQLRRSATIEPGVPEERDMRLGDVRKACTPDRFADLAPHVLPRKAQ